MIVCPICGRALPEEDLVCKCGAHLGLLKQLVDRANSLLNRAISAGQAGDFETALRLLNARAEMMPPDVDVSILQVKLLAHLNCWNEASDALSQLQAAAPDHPAVVQLVEVLAARKTLSSEGE
jgi:uncharacterized protein HemY